jgi:hypothetical protein
MPTLLAGGGAKLLEYGFTAKGTYVARGSVSYIDGVVALWKMLVNTRSTAELKLLFTQHLFILPLLGVVALGVVWIIDRARRSTTTFIAIFYVAAFLSTLPRVDASHLATSVPLVAVAIANSLDRQTRQESTRMARLGAAITFAFILWTTAGAAALMMWSVQRMTSDQYVRTALPHFRSELLDSVSEGELRRSCDALRSIVRSGDSPFLLSGRAAFHYLAVGLKNPTPFDYPYVTAFGAEGEGGIIRRLKDGEISQVAVDLASQERAVGSLWPRDLERYLHENTTLVARRGTWELYERIAP